MGERGGSPDLGPGESAAAPSTGGVKHVTILEIARRCGVAPSTVSNTLTGRRYVQPETRKRVLEVVNEFGYRPSAIARSLRLQKSWSLAVVVGRLVDPFSARVVVGVEETALKSDYQVLVSNTNYDMDREARHVELLMDKRVDGVIIMSSSLHDQSIARLEEARVPFVLVSRRHLNIHTNYVGVDNLDGMRSAVEHLVSLGHRRVAFIGGNAEESSTTREKVDAFKQTLLQNGGNPTEIVGTDFSFAGGYRALRQLFDGHLTPFSSAVIAVNDVTAFGVMDAALELGLRVPNDLSVVGWDDVFPAALRSIQLTTVHQPAEEMGSAAAQMLIDQLGNGPSGSSVQRIFSPSLVVRGTTARIIEGE